MDKDLIKKSISELNIELIGAKERVKGIDSAIEGLRKLCKHEWNYVGH